MNWNSRGAFVVIASVFLTILALVAHRWITEAIQFPTYEPYGYYDLVNVGLRDLIRFDEVRAIPRGDGDVAAPPELGYAQDRADPGQWTFIRQSFIEEDLEDPSRFRRRDQNRAELRSGFRARPLPFIQDQSWTGSVQFRSSSVRPRLVSTGGETYIFQKPTGPQIVDPDNRIAMNTVDNPPQIRSGSIFAWKHGGKDIFTMQMVQGSGDNWGVVLVRPEKSSNIRLRINGSDAPSLGEQRQVWPGDWIVVDNLSNKRYVFYLEQQSSGIISRIEQGRQGARRTISTSGAIDSIARPLVNALNSFVWNQSTTLAANQRRTSGSVRKKVETWLNKLKRDSISLSIDEALQVAAQGALEDFVNHHGRQQRYWKQGRLPRLPPRAAMTVVDAKTGQLLAAATYPTKQAIDKHIEGLKTETPRDLEQAKLLRYSVMLAERRREKLEANHALDHHQIGSVVKPLFGAAAALAWLPSHGPDADPLRIKATCTGHSHTEEEFAHRGDETKFKALDVVGFPSLDPLPMGVWDEDARHGEVDFEDFIARSCNPFMFRLGAIALHQAGANAELTCPDGVAGTLQTSGDSAFAVYWKMYDLITALPGTRTYTQQLSWWDPLSSEMERWVKKDGFGCGFAGGQPPLAWVSPEAVNLRVRSINTCDPDFSSFLKGGGTNRWSNMQTGVAYARLMTGRQVQGSLLEKAFKTKARTKPLEIARTDTARYNKVRDSVLAGMAKSIERGTARRLASYARETVDRLRGTKKDASPPLWGAFAKTGTSDRPVKLVRRVNRFLQPRRGDLQDAKLKVANLVVLLMRCEDGSQRRHGVGCQLPNVGDDEVHGYVINIWSEGIPTIINGTRLIQLLNNHGATFRDRLVELEETRQ